MTIKVHKRNNMHITDNFIIDFWLIPFFGAVVSFFYVVLKYGKDHSISLLKTIDEKLDIIIDNL